MNPILWFITIGSFVFMLLIHILHGIMARYTIRDRIHRTGRRVVKISRSYDLTGNGTLQIPDLLQIGRKHPISHTIYYSVYQVTYATKDGTQHTSYLPFRYGTPEWRKFYDTERWAHKFQEPH